MRMIAKFPGLADEQWLDCSEARGTIALFGNEVKVSNRPQAYVRFVSPADGRACRPGRTHHGSIEDDAGQRGLPIYADKKDAAIVDPDF